MLCGFLRTKSLKSGQIFRKPVGKSWKTSPNIEKYRHMPVNFELPPPSSPLELFPGPLKVYKLNRLPKIPLLRPNENKTEALHVLKPSKY